MTEDEIQHFKEHVLNSKSYLPGIKSPEELALEDDIVDDHFGSQEATKSTDNQKISSDFREILLGAEGYRNDAYLDNRGILTIGIGHKIIPSDKLEIGDKISDSRVEQFYDRDAGEAPRAALSQASTAGISSTDFIVELASVNFQLGTHWTAKFKDTWRLISSGNYQAAAKNIKKSDWYKESQGRAQKFIDELYKLPERGR